MAHVINLAAQNSKKAFSDPIDITTPPGLSAILNDPPAQINISTTVSCISGFHKPFCSAPLRKLLHFKIAPKAYLEKILIWLLMLQLVHNGM